MWALLGCAGTPDGNEGAVLGGGELGGGTQADRSAWKVARPGVTYYSRDPKEAGQRLWPTLQSPGHLLLLTLPFPMELVYLGQVFFFFFFNQAKSRTTECKE